ncbi:hypothetical protein Y032_0009g661 [Ancylostoma ceylanicum]|uniref:Uncharacterized protein n=1 Tax=Ancylostoma ceylanicum TaxID=53326 RepID=A0A016VJ59_9BILA|nr:hypothetical protein Y032_0009g661 [Ancylostoma ceylanicum]
MKRGDWLASVSGNHPGAGIGVLATWLPIIRKFVNKHMINGEVVVLVIGDGPTQGRCCRGSRIPAGKGTQTIGISRIRLKNG